MTAYEIGELQGEAGAAIVLVWALAWLLSYPWRVPQSLVDQPEQLAEVTRRRNRVVRRVFLAVAALWLLSTIATGVWIQMR